MILQRYVLKEVVQTFGGVTAVLFLIYVSHRFVHFLTQAAAGYVSGGLIAELVALKLVTKLVILLPFALYIAVLFGLGRLYKDSEVTAMTASGLGVLRIAKHLIWFLVFCSLVALLLAVYIGPNAAKMQESVLARAKGEAIVAAIVPGRFKEFGKGDQVFYVEDIDADSGDLRNVFVQVRKRGRHHVIIAKRGYLSEATDSRQGFFVLEDGYRYTGAPGDLDYVITKFERHAVKLDDIGKVDRLGKLASVPTFDLWYSEELHHKAELQTRLSHPISVILLGLLALPLARTSPREGRFAKVFVAIVAYFAYGNALGIAEKLVQSGKLPAIIGVWPVHLILAAIVAYLLFGRSIKRPASSDPQGNAAVT